MSFWYIQFSQKMNNKFDFTTMVPQVELFSFIFWENWIYQKYILKLTDLYNLTTFYILGQKFVNFFCWFFGKFKTKKHSEINRPLVRKIVPWTYKKFRKKSRICKNMQLVHYIDIKKCVKYFSFVIGVSCSQSHWHLSSSLWIELFCFHN